MARPTLLLIAAALMVGLGAVEARADERVVGPGYAFDLPERFNTKAGPWEVVARATCETLVQGLPFRPAAEPLMRFHAVPATNGPEAILVVCRFDLKPGDALTSIHDLPVASIRAAHEHAMDTLPGGQLKQTLREKLGGDLPAIGSLFTYPHPSAGERTVQTAIVVSDCTGVLLLLDAPSDLQVEYEAYFASISDALRVLKPAPSLLAEFRYAIYAIGGLLAILLVVLVVLRRRRANKRVPLETVTPRMRVISVDHEPTAMGAASEEAEPARRAGRAPQVPVELSPAAVVQPERRETAAAAAAPQSGAVRSRLRDTLTERTWEKETPAVTPDPDDTSETPEDDERAPPEADVGAEPSRTPTLRIQRNTDYLKQ